MNLMEKVLAINYQIQMINTLEHSLKDTIRMVQKY